ncbi:MAG: carbamoyltransferase HypF [Phycisphaerae bacterium]|nr:carbamoyltransferase HypF [Phycisphaerae bacterium]
MSQPTSQHETVLDVPLVAREPILAVGADLKSAPALMVDSKIYVAPPIGRLDEPEAYRRFLAAIEGLQQRQGRRANVIAHDLHPDYAATRWAMSQPERKIGVQHHHAHATACMAEHGLVGKTVGIVCDGTGYGADGTIWGGEVLLCDFDAGEFRRAGYLRPFPLLGGDAAAVETFRPALGVLVETFGKNWPAEAQHVLSRIDPQALKLAVARLGAPAARLPRTSSLGRLFDATAFLLDLCPRNDTEAQAPVAVQQAAEQARAVEPLDYKLEEAPDGAVIMDFRPMIRAMLREAGDAQQTARAFHDGLVNMLAAAAGRVCDATGEHRVVLTGGCFLNTLLQNWLEERLRRDGREVYLHRRLSSGDESTAVGQALVAAARSA